MTDVIQNSIDENHYVPMNLLRNELIEKKATKAIREVKGFKFFKKKWSGNKVLYFFNENISILKIYSNNTFG